MKFGIEEKAFWCCM